MMVSKQLGAGLLLSVLMAAASAGDLIVEGEAPAAVAPSASAPAMNPAMGAGPGMGMGMPSLWAVSESDVSVYGALTRWAKKEGWTFRMEHWTVSNDFPIQGSAAWPGMDFKGAVRALLDTTLSSTSPVQPCFYSNRVIRVVPRTEMCSRAVTGAPAIMSAGAAMAPSTPPGMGMPAMANAGN